MTVSKTQDASKQPIPLSPLGQLHSYSSCAYCGAKPNEAELQRNIISLTFAEGLTCVDLDGCLRRRLRRAA